jgi:hypothetical protein
VDACNPGFPDLAIAATAVAQGLTVLTANLRHFAPLDVPAHNPLESLPKDQASPRSLPYFAQGVYST